MPDPSEDPPFIPSGQLVSLEYTELENFVTEEYSIREESPGISIDLRANVFHEESLKSDLIPETSSHPVRYRNRWLV